MFRQRRAAIDKIGGIGRISAVHGTHPDAEQAKLRAVSLTL
jgi:hypothetical protein